MNKEAGSGTWLIVSLAFRGEELPFMVDTGSPITLFDQSLEPTLGKRLDDATFWSPAGGSHQSGIYLAPKISLNGTALTTDTYVVSYPFHQLSARSHQRVMGVLGMDCLRHYCVQLDFQTRRIRFLTSIPTNSTELGKAFPLKFSNEHQDFPAMFRDANQNDSCPYLLHTGLFGGVGTNLVIDTGDNVDGAVEKLQSGGITRPELLTSFSARMLCVCRNAFGTAKPIPNCGSMRASIQTSLGSGFWPAISSRSISHAGRCI